jgi:hypothetical protein
MYRLLRADVEAVYSLPNKHVFATGHYGNPCWFYGKPYISNCDFDTAKRILSHIYGPLAERTEAKAENLRKFKQLEFVSEKDSALAENGFVYVPELCRTGLEKCRVHMFLHGCGMNEYYIGDAVYRNSGFNEWGESNGIVIIYPQAASSSTLTGKACWDGGGRSDKYYDTKIGIHVKALFEISQNIERIIFATNN